MPLCRPPPRPPSRAPAQARQHSPGMLETHRTWALQTVNWSTTVPGWLASMMTTLLVVRVLVRIHTRLEVASVSESSFACQSTGDKAGARAWGGGCPGVIRTQLCPTWLSSP